MSEQPAKKQVTMKTWAIVAGLGLLGVIIGLSSPVDGPTNFPLAAGSIALVVGVGGALIRLARDYDRKNP